MLFSWGVGARCTQTVPASTAAALLAFLRPPPPLNASELQYSLLSAPQSQHETHSEWNSTYLPHHCSPGTTTCFNKQQQMQLQECELSPHRGRFVPPPRLQPYVQPCFQPKRPRLAYGGFTEPLPFPRKTNQGQRFLPSAKPQP